MSTTTNPKPPAPRLLVIEDNEADALLYALVLRRAGFEVLPTIHDGLEGLNAVFSDPPDAIVLDLDLPRVRGEEICRIVRSTPSLAAVPIVVISGLPEAKRRELELLRVGAHAYLEKPFLEDELVERVRTLTSAARSGGAQAAVAAATPLSLATPFAGIESPTFEGYEILDVVGAGGMGTVYRARQTRLGRIVALKVLLDSLVESDRVRRRFEQEARILAQVTHPNIVTVYDAGSTEYTRYMAMEYVEGADLRGYIQAGALSEAFVLSVLRQMASAIDHLHSRGIIHRDIKPSNVLVRRDGLVKLSDFGISHARAPFADEGLSTQLEFLGTVGYAPPESLGGGEPTRAMDIYALGRTAWAVLTGADARSWSMSVAELRPDLPGDVSGIVDRALDRDPARRPASASEFVEDLVRAFEAG